MKTRELGGLTVNLPTPRKRMCYLNAYELASHNQDQPWRVVHGVVNPPSGECAGKQIGHAWCEVEIDGVMYVYDPSLSLWTTQAIYYQHLVPEAVVRYTLTEARALLQSTHHIGPWDDAVSGAVHAKLPWERKEASA